MQSACLQFGGGVPEFELLQFVFRGRCVFRGSLPRWSAQFSFLRWLGVSDWRWSSCAIQFAHHFRGSTSAICWAFFIPVRWGFQSPSSPIRQFQLPVFPNSVGFFFRHSLPCLAATHLQLFDEIVSLPCGELSSRDSQDFSSRSNSDELEQSSLK